MVLKLCCPTHRHWSGRQLSSLSPHTSPALVLAIMPVTLPPAPAHMRHTGLHGAVVVGRMPQASRYPADGGGRQLAGGYLGGSCCQVARTLAAVAPAPYPAQLLLASQGMVERQGGTLQGQVKQPPGEESATLTHAGPVVSEGWPLGDMCMPVHELLQLSTHLPWLPASSLHLQRLTVDLALTQRLLQLTLVVVGLRIGLGSLRPAAQQHAVIWHAGPVKRAPC